MTTYKRGARAGQPRATSEYVCPTEWSPDDSLIAEVAQLAPDVDQTAELTKFRAHDHLRPFRQWSSVYRKWMKRAQRRIDWERDGTDPRQAA